MKYQKNWDHWTVIYLGGAKRYFKNEENARTEALMYGIGLIGPLYSNSVIN